MSEVRRFFVTGTGAPASDLSGLGDREELRITSASVVDRTFLDTADGRLDRADVVLELRRPVEGGGPATLVCVDDGRVVSTQTLAAAEAPRFVDDLPAGASVDLLAGLMEMRALVPGPTVRCRVTMLAALDAEEKTTARVQVEEAALLDGTELPVLVELHQLRGYDREADRLQKLLVSRLELEPCTVSMARFARSAAGVPGFVPTKLRLMLGPSSAADAWRVVLRALTDTMAANFAGTVADTDSEFLHDFRVAVRRTRSVLKEGAHVLPPESREHFRDGFKWLGDITTPQRDADVHLLDFPDLVASLPPERAEALEPLRALLVERQRSCHQQLVTDLRSLRRARLGQEWAAFLAGEGAWPADDGGEPGSDAPEALDPAIVVVAKRIRKAHRRLVQDGRAIDDASPATALHDLRKDAKRLRYLLECFGSLFPVGDVATAVKPLKSLQDTLGTFQDTEVQIHALEGFGEQLIERGAGAPTLLAMGAVIENVGARGVGARKEFATRFATFDSAAVRAAYKRLSLDAEAAS
ncbi:MAG TPA: CHAD domain-containing protein [Acidimicrobiales bacterium]